MSFQLIPWAARIEEMNWFLLTFSVLTLYESTGIPKRVFWPESIAVESTGKPETEAVSEGVSEETGLATSPGGVFSAAPLRTQESDVSIAAATRAAGTNLNLIQRCLQYGLVLL